MFYTRGTVKFKTISALDEARVTRSKNEKHIVLLHRDRFYGKTQTFFLNLTEQVLSDSLLQRTHKLRSEITWKGYNGVA